jgi:S-adenosylmethionine decarboxylase
VHTFPQRCFLHVDVFSDRTFDVEVALAALKEAFRPRRVEWKLLDRRLGFPEFVGAARAAALESRTPAAPVVGPEALR